MSRPEIALALLAVMLHGGIAGASAPPYETTFRAAATAEALATVTIQCDACAWDVAGREGVWFSIALDGRYVQHLPVVRSGRAEYRLLLGSVQPGTHSIRIVEDGALTAGALKGTAATVHSVDVQQVTAQSPDYRAISLAPVVYARPDTVGRFTDVPVFMWYELEPTPGGTRYRYSVIFTNEDGGTPADRLMATWGRTTDIEYLYSVEVDAGGAVLSEDMQGPEHEVLPFAGRREAGHPLLWVSTENNMVLDKGATTVRYAPAPVAFALRDVSREAVMDANPWLYDVMARELAREGKIVADAKPGTRTIPDPRRFVYLEACGEVGDTALAFAVQVAGDGATAAAKPAWISSDRGLENYRITRDGCFRAAIPLPGRLTAADVRVLRVQAFMRSGRTGGAPASVTRVNAMFSLDDRYMPGASRVRWQGAAALRPGGPALEIPVP